MRTILKPTTFFLLAATLVLECTSLASAAIFEVGHPFSGASRGEVRLLHGSGTKAPYQQVRIRNAGEQTFSSLNALAANPEDLLWIVISDAGTLEIKDSTFNVDTSAYLFEFATDSPSIARRVQEDASNVRAERTAPKIWVFLLIGAGLVWFQMRRKARHHAIRFTRS